MLTFKNSIGALHIVQTADQMHLVPIPTLTMIPLDLFQEDMNLVEVKKSKTKLQINRFLITSSYLLHNLNFV